MGISTVVFSFLKTIWNNKTLRYFVLSLVLAISLKIGYSLITQYYYKSGYDAGESQQVKVHEDEQSKLKADYDKQLKVKDTEVLALNEELQQLKQDYSDLQQKRKDKSNKTSEETKNYEKSPNGNNRCLDSEWVRIYKNSLPE